MNRYIAFALFLTFISCKKEEIKNYENMSSTEYFSIATDLKSLKKLEKSKINDSLYKIKGIFNSYEITGYIDKNNRRVNWWQAFDKKKNELSARLEYRLIDNKEFVNQYILLKKGKIDTLKSKFYSVNKDTNFLKYRFYMPAQSNIIRSKGKLNYGYFYQGKEKKHFECECIKNNNIFECEFSIPLANANSTSLIIKGNFWEMFQLENGDVGENDIYVLDTL